MTLVPSHWVAKIAKAGISSISRGTKAPEIRNGFSEDGARTSTSATGSPELLPLVGDLNRDTAHPHHVEDPGAGRVDRKILQE